MYSALSVYTVLYVDHVNFTSVSLTAVLQKKSNMISILPSVPLSFFPCAITVINSGAGGPKFIDRRQKLSCRKGSLFLDVPT